MWVAGLQWPWVAGSFCSGEGGGWCAGAACRVPSTGDPHGTTSTKDNDLFVGCVSGQDAGYAGETGAERRQSEDPNSST